MYVLCRAFDVNFIMKSGTAWFCRGLKLAVVVFSSRAHCSDVSLNWQVNAPRSRYPRTRTLSVCVFADWCHITPITRCQFELEFEFILSRAEQDLLFACFFSEFLPNPMVRLCVAFVTHSRYLPCRTSVLSTAVSELSCQLSCSSDCYALLGDALFDWKLLITAAGTVLP